MCPSRRTVGVWRSETYHRGRRRKTWIYTAEGGAARFENLVASHLLKLCHFLADTEGHTVELRYVRDREGREVDFLVTVGRKPWFLVEAKLAQAQVDPAIVHFRRRLGLPPAYQVTLEGGRDFVQDGVRVVPASRFLAALV